MPAGRVYMAQGIVRYDDKRGMSGKLLGIITFTDGKSLKVWDAELHEQCKPLGAQRTVQVRYQFKHSKKWGDSLSMIERATPKPAHEVYDELRAKDEQRGRLKPNSYLGRKLTKDVSAA